MANVLIVEDDADTMQLLKALLAREGHAVEGAANGWDGLRVAGEHRFDLILVDIMLPGIHGGKFLHFLRRTIGGRDVPVIVVTALDRSVAEERIGASRVEGIVVKTPTRMIGELVETVRSILGSSKSASEGPQSNEFVK